MFNHPPRFVRDTARYRPFMRQHGMVSEPIKSDLWMLYLLSLANEKKLRPRALRRLVEEHIGIKIQSGEHDSVLYSLVDYVNIKIHVD